MIYLTLSDEEAEWNQWDLPWANCQRVRASSCTDVLSGQQPADWVEVTAQSWRSLFRHIQPDRLHKLKRVAGFDDAGFQFVVEDQLAIFESVLEVSVGRPVSHGVGNLR